VIADAVISKNINFCMSQTATSHALQNWRQHPMAPCVSQKVISQSY